MVAAGCTTGKKILLVDRSPKQNNDRTWCFWEDQPGFFEPVVCKQWSQLWFHATGFSKQLDMAPYQYKMIRGIDFYRHCFAIIQAQPGIDTLYGAVTDLSFSGNCLQFKIDQQPYAFTGAVVFNSILNEAAVKQQNPIWLLQHFKGWMVETPQPFFTPGQATLMDFRVSQANGTTFVYVLPLSATRALVEYTLFSEKILPRNSYDEALARYLQQVLQLTTYTITEEEFGVIPMTSARFPWYANGMYHIGTAGGQTKASSGYTFQFIQKQSAAITACICSNTLSPLVQPAAVSGRFHFYDSILLRVLAGKHADGSRVFADLFHKNAPQSIFRFLDNASSPATDIGIIQSLPTRPFLKALFQQLIHS